MQSPIVDCHLANYFEHFATVPDARKTLSTFEVVH